MATARFDFPTAAAPTDSVVFTEGYRYPFGGTDQRIQLSEQSAAGQVFVYDKGIEVLAVDLTFQRLSKALFDQLRAFLRTVTLMAFNPFDFTDHDGNVVRVRYVADSFQWSLTDHQHYACQLSLRQEIGA